MVDVGLCAVRMFVFCGCVVVESEFLQVRVEFGAWSMFSFSNCARFLLRSRRGAFPLRVAVSIVVHCWAAGMCGVGVSSLWFLSFDSSLLCFCFVRLLRSIFVLQLIACERSTSPPGGNQVDGLPLALRNIIVAGASRHQKC